MAIADVSATLSVQGVTSKIPVEGIQRLWLNGVLFGDEVDVGHFQDSSNLSDDHDSNPISLRNVSYLSANTASVNTILPTVYGSSIYGIDTYGGNRSTGTQMVNLPISANDCQLRLNITSDIPIAITSISFYAYDGVTDVNPFPRIVFYAAEGEISTQWVPANGLSQALTLTTHPLAITHDYFVALSASPNDTGDKQGKIKFLYTYSQS